MSILLIYRKILTNLFSCYTCSGLVFWLELELRFHLSVLLSFLCTEDTGQVSIPAFTTTPWRLYYVWKDNIWCVLKSNREFTQPFELYTLNLSIIKEKNKTRVLNIDSGKGTKSCFMAGRLWGRYVISIMLRTIFLFCLIQVMIGYLSDYLCLFRCRHCPHQWSQVLYLKSEPEKEQKSCQ